MTCFAIKSLATVLVVVSVCETSSARTFFGAIVPLVPMFSDDDLCALESCRLAVKVWQNVELKIADLILIVRVLRPQVPSRRTSCNGNEGEKSILETTSDIIVVLYSTVQYSTMLYMFRDIQGENLQR